MSTITYTSSRGKWSRQNAFT